MKTLKKLPFVLAFVFTLFAAACSDIDVRPSGGGEDDDDPIIIPPPGPQNASSDSTSIG